MIEGYEKYTEELNEQEKKLFPMFISCMKAHIGKAAAISNGKIRQGFKTNCNIELGGSRVRKIINIIQNNNLIPHLVSSSKGYYVATDRSDIVRYVASVRSRANSIYQVSEAVAAHEGVSDEEINKYLKEYYFDDFQY